MAGFLDRIFGNGAVQAPKPKSRMGRPRQDARNEDIRRKYEAGATAQVLADEHGISRERVCQLLRPYHLIDMKQLRRQVAAQIVAENIEQEKQAARAKIDQAIALVNSGMSVVKAAHSIGLTRHVVQHACFKAGANSGKGRWRRDYSHRIETLTRLVGEGRSIKYAIDVLRQAGDKCGHQWVQEHCPELIEQARNFHRSLLRVPLSSSGNIWTDEKTTECRTLWISGRSAQQIADVFGPPFTRNAVIGKVNRMRAAGQLFTGGQP